MSLLSIRNALFVVTLSFPAVAIAFEEPQPAGTKPAGIEVGAFPNEFRSVYTTEHGLASDDVWSVAIGPRGVVFAGTSKGLFRLEDDRWHAVNDFQGDVRLIAPHGEELLVAMGTSVYRLDAKGASLWARPPGGIDNAAQLTSLTGNAGRVLLGTAIGLFEHAKSGWVPVDDLNGSLGDDKGVRQVAVAAEGRTAVAAASGLYLSDSSGKWTLLAPRDEKRSWAPVDVRGVAFDRKNQLWFASPQGVGCQHEDGTWSLYTGYEGVPYDDFTTVAAGEEGVVWFGTTMGAFRFDGENWNYRRGRMWLPDDVVRSIAVNDEGDAWFATPKGAGLIDRKPSTLADKAKFFEDEIDKYHRRTPFGYVLHVHLESPGDKSKFTQSDSDNDGLWTGMYGAGECFAYAATKDPAAKKRARAAFEALRFLSQVTQGGSNPAPPGFPARTILPASDGDPNRHYTAERDRESQKEDPFWKVLVPRWPLSADKKWYWKTDTSSDELDGHYFLNALYHDLVAETAAEKARARDVIVAITDHLIDHNFQLVDHDGKPTRWARYSPEMLNGGVLWVERGLNSLSMLSYLKTAEHVSGDKKYGEVYDHLVKDHSYATNVLEPKLQNGPGSGNQSDDEMAFMCYYNLFKYEDDPELRKMYNISLRKYWGIEKPEMNPLFNFIFLASYDGTFDAYWEGFGLPGGSESQAGLEEAVEELKRYPWERLEWGYKNSHRTDVVPLPDYVIEGEGRGMRRNGKVVPIDERFVGHWNHSPWNLDSGSEGRTLADGASFLLPYYMGLHHGFIVEVGK